MPHSGISDLFQNTTHPALGAGALISAVPDLVKMHVRKINRTRYYRQGQKAGVMIGEMAADGEDQVGIS